MSSWTYNNFDYNKNFGTWVYDALNKNPATPAQTDKQIIESILEHPNLEDKGFFEDMVAWLRKDAPKKLGSVLNGLYYSGTGLGRANADLSYNNLCKMVYSAGFRASEVLERRMILGPTNEWVKKYFEDFA